MIALGHPNENGYNLALFILQIAGSGDKCFCPSFCIHSTWCLKHYNCLICVWMTKRMIFIIYSWAVRRKHKDIMMLFPGKVGLPVNVSSVLWFSTALTLWPFNIVPHDVVIPNHKLILCCFVSTILLLLLIIAYISDIWTIRYVTPKGSWPTDWGTTVLVLCPGNLTSFLFTKHFRKVNLKTPCGDVWFRMPKEA